MTHRLHIRGGVRIDKTEITNLDQHLRAQIEQIEDTEIDQPPIEATPTNVLSLFACNSFDDPYDAKAQATFRHFGIDETRWFNLEKIGSDARFAR